MDINDMHYDFKVKLNKVDSQQYRNLRIPEIDWVLNKAQEIFVKNIAFPRNITDTGFEISQRNIDDIRTLVIEQLPITKNSNDTFELPGNYMFYVSANVMISKDSCGSKSVRLIIRQHDDLFEQSPFTKSSYEWGEVNGTFDRTGLKVYTDGTFTIDDLKITYIKKPQYIHNAVNFLPSGRYVLPNGEVLTGSVSSELPEHTHSEIVDLAVLLTTNSLNSELVQFKQLNLNLNK